MERWIPAFTGMTPSSGTALWAAGLIAALAGPAFAQEEGWHYSPIEGEGDRAAAGCGFGSTPDQFACLVVRCEDDFSVGVHIHTSRPGGDAGRWRIDIDKEDGIDVDAKPDRTPYNARVDGDVTDLIDALKNGAIAYLDPKAGQPVPKNGITLAGSLYVINQALYFCAPKVSAEAGKEEAND